MLEDRWLKLEQIHHATGLRGEALLSEYAKQNPVDADRPWPWSMLKPIEWPEKLPLSDYYHKLDRLLFGSTNQRRMGNA